MWAYLRNRSVHGILLLVVVDICILTLAMYGGYVIRHSARTLSLSLDLAFEKANPFLVVAVMSHVAFAYVHGLYARTQPDHPMRLLLSVAFAIGGSTAWLMFLQFFVPGYWIGRVVLAIQVPLCIAALYGWRLLYFRSNLSRLPKRRLALVGPAPLIAQFIQEAAAPLATRYRIHAVCPTQPPSAVAPMALPPGAASCASVADLLDDPQLEAVAFRFQDPGLGDAEIQALLHRACEGLEISDLVTLFKGVTGKVPLRYLDPLWLLSYAGIQGGPTPGYLKIKRLLDLVVASLALFMALPVMIPLAVLVRLDSRGPVLFRQERLGRFRRPFLCLKFRTMVDRAEEQTGPVWSAPHDPRITRVGRWLRQLRLDELPQLINVIRGDMSLIGPRPIRAHFADQISRRMPLYELRFALKPGLTGWAQVNHPYADSDGAQMEKFEYELFYIQNASLFLDGLILLMTLRTLFERKGQ